MVDGPPRPGICPHCSGIDIDEGETGLDLCRSCGGLSRGARRLLEAAEAERHHQWLVALADRHRRLRKLAEDVVALDEFYSGQDVVVGDLGRRAREALAE